MAKKSKKKAAGKKTTKKVTSENAQEIAEETAKGLVGASKELKGDDVKTEVVEETKSKSSSKASPAKQAESESELLHSFEARIANAQRSGEEWIEADEATVLYYCNQRIPKSKYFVHKNVKVALKGHLEECIELEERPSSYYNRRLVTDARQSAHPTLFGFSFTCNQLLLGFCCTQAHQQAYESKFC